MPMLIDLETSGRIALSACFDDCTYLKSVIRILDVVRKDLRFLILISVERMDSS
jgi:hypothetical protein